MATSISDTDLERLKSSLEGTCQELSNVLDSLGLDVEIHVAEDRLLDGCGAIERCKECDWWHESAVLEWSDKHQGGVCQQCCPELFE